MNIGIVCYASVGGSGIVATELAKILAGRGHEVHLISSETPFRLGDYQAGLAFHRVTTPAYPLFREPQYLLSLTNRIVTLAREFSLDIVHAHYAVPHATAAFRVFLWPGGDLFFVADRFLHRHRPIDPQAVASVVQVGEIAE